MSRSVLERPPEPRSVPERHGASARAPQRLQTHHLAPWSVHGIAQELLGKLWGARGSVSDRAEHPKAPAGAHRCIRETSWTTQEHPGVPAGA